MASVESSADQKLSTVEHWSTVWEHVNQPSDITFDPNEIWFSFLHRLFQRTLPKDKSFRFLEVGAHPGGFMWYFHKYFEYQVSGLEYVEWCAEQTKRNMESLEIPSEVIHGDLFDFEVDDDKRWDVVGSFGLVEHFSDSASVVKRHLDLVKPGGYLVLSIPNHHGINGSILKACDSENFRVHNCMSYQDLESALNVAGGAEVVEGGYFGGIGFWNSGLYQRLGTLGMMSRPLSAPFKITERLGSFLPNTALFSPNAVLVARKLPS